MKQFRLFMLRYWEPILWGGAAIILVGGLLLFSLGSLTPGATEAEVAAANESHSLSAIAHNPIYAPHKLLQYGLRQISEGSLFTFRLASALCGIATSLLFFYVLKSWYTTRVALLGTFVFVTSAWFLHVSRVGTPEILLTSLLAVLVAGIWLRESRRRSLSLLIACVAGTVLIYIPGMIWLVAAAGVWQRKLLAREMTNIPTTHIVLAITTALLLLAPLGYGLFTDPSLIRTVFGLPEHLPSVIDMGRNLVNIPLQLFALRPESPATWLGNLALLDIFSAAMFVLGCYAFVYYRKLDRSAFIAGIFVLGSLLIMLDGPVTISLIMPFVYIIVATGIALMLRQWFTVFPRNPLARAVGANIVTAAVLLAGFYHINHYFIAWPNAPETREAVSHQLQ